MENKIRDPFDEVFEEILAEDPSEEAQHFRIDDDFKAEWAVRKIAEEKAEFERMDELAVKSIKYYSDKREEYANRFQKRTSYLSAMLNDYFRSVPHRKTATQESYSLPSGKLVIKHKAPVAERDDEKLCGWLEENAPQFVKVKREPVWGELKKTLTVSGDSYITDEGEIVPGLRAVPQDDEFKVVL